MPDPTDHAERPRPSRLEGRVAVVTGSSTGNGRAIALALAEEGAVLVCADLRPDPVPGAQEIRPDLATDQLVCELGGNARYEAADVQSEEQMEHLADFAVESFGSLDIWVNNAGVAGLDRVTEEPRAKFEEVMQVNSVGTWLGCRAAARRMQAQPLRGRSRGRIVNLGSVRGSTGGGRQGAYASSKGAVHALTRDLAVELAAERINVNAIAPGLITQTAMVAGGDPEFLEQVKARHPWPDLGSPADIGRAAAFLASDDAAWITGVVLPVDGGLLAA